MYPPKEIYVNSAEQATNPKINVKIFTKARRVGSFYSWLIRQTRNDFYLNAWPCTWHYLLV